ncbi:MAG: bifunctional (p)ppGpp synthetase/guanosine-3',5'-bis(diphosphate) 3'-pyrophosphohydrolase [Firmicutes bacterium]|uniref:GTP diphosphokinase n=1 Tax=Sulfobacillus benefaciens TaxID=453960 RepID=A0A2T2WX53_9FIRM|nr:bifunctional (p)ppGpp synthetase/guanosine-3',5'-bis(diphosphate) 3'-pyrophosphohydrolase [Bacillota bacterium]PSR26825.1 MAG: (p)ppGpp synthetase [Sulfobacillus benefaciens]
MAEKLGFTEDSAEAEQIAQAIDFARRAHAGQSRASGDPYIEHPLAVASILADLKMDVPTIVAALLHDVVEDTPFTLDDIEQSFGSEVAQLVDGVTKLDRLEVRTREEEQAENLRKMLLAMAKDIRVILIKLADRLHNMRTLKHLDANRVQRIAKETMEIYAPLAHRLGIYRIKWELEDLAFQHLQPESFQTMKELVAKKRKEREAAVEAVTLELTRRLEQMGMVAELSGRAKHLYSIYQKMYKQGKDFSQIFDLVAIRVMVETVKDCYAVLGLVHSLWKPVPGRFKDYIAMPKSNLYQSLHTTVMGPEGEPIEVQIRTFEMHHTAEYGIAAHWRYKEGSKEDREFEQKLSWLRQLLEWQRDMRDAREFMDTLKVDLFSDEVFVFTPRGDVLDLPTGSTPIDFAYRIHTDVGNHCVGAKINGRIVPLTTTLENGDIVEVLVNRKSPGPSVDWLNIVQTSQAKNRIRQWIRKERRQEHLSRGQEILERELRRAGLSLQHERLQELVKKVGYGTVDELAVGISDGMVNPVQAVNRVKDELTKEIEPVITPIIPPKRGPGSKVGPAQVGQQILVRGQSRLLTRLARCCQPVPGDPIIGYLTRGRGVSVHRLGCPNEKELSKDPERLIEVSWDIQEAELAPHPVELAVFAWDRAGLLADVANVVADANIISAKARGLKDRTAIVNVRLEVKNLTQLTRIIRRLEALPFVERVERVSHEKS